MSRSKVVVHTAIVLYFLVCVDFVISLFGGFFCSLLLSASRHLFTQVRTLIGKTSAAKVIGRVGYTGMVETCLCLQSNGGKQ
jgi:hypothetical protein